MSSDNHNYDGIEELDNPLPNWWLFIFLGTIIFAFIYFLHYASGTGLTQTAELEIQMKNLPKPAEKIWTEEELNAPFGAPENIASGKAIFVAKCVACHGNEGQGVIGPNLTDNFWIHGKGQRKDILDVVQKGVVANGMPAWGGVISESEAVHVSAFVYSLKGTKPANPKAPQGEEVKIQ